MENWDKAVKAFSAVCGAISGIFGGWDTMMEALVILMALDYVTGLIVAAMGRSTKSDGGRLDSKAGFIGIAKKALILSAVFLASMVDRVLPDEQAIFRSMMCWFYIANEGISVIENLALAGVPFPEQLTNALEQMRDRNRKNGDKGI